MKSLVLSALLCFSAASLFSQPKSSPAKNEKTAIENAPRPTPSNDDQETAAEVGGTKRGSLPWYASSEWWLVWIAALTGLAIAYQAREMTRATEVMQGQLREMQTAGEETAKQLGLTERPWVSPRVYIVSGLTADENGIHVTIRIELTNVGNSPAVGILIEPVLYLQKISKPHVVDERKRLCEQVIARSPTWGQIIFPKGDPYIQDFTISATPEDIAKSRIGEGNIPDALAANIILCVAYRSTVDDKAKHYTALIYELTRHSPQRPNLMFGLLAGESVPQQELKLFGSIFGPLAQ